MRINKRKGTEILLVVCPLAVVTGAVAVVELIASVVVDPVTVGGTVPVVITIGAVDGV